MRPRRDEVGKRLHAARGAERLLLQLGNGAQLARQIAAQRILRVRQAARYRAVAQGEDLPAEALHIPLPQGAVRAHELVVQRHQARQLLLAGGAQRVPVPAQIVCAQVAEQMRLPDDDFKQQRGIAAVLPGGIAAEHGERLLRAQSGGLRRILRAEGQRVERVAPDERLARQRLFRRAGEEQAHRIKRLARQARQALARKVDLALRAAFPLPARLREHRQQAQAEEEVRLRAVVPPHRRQHGAHAPPGAHAQRRAHRRLGHPHMRQEARPRPHAPGEDRLPPHALVLGDHAVVEGLAVVVVVPVAQVDRRQAVDDLLRDDGLLVVVVVLARAQAEEHVAPHDRPEAVAPAQRDDPAQVAAQQRETVGLPVAEQVLPQPHAVRLVHADVDAIRAHAGAQRAQLRVDERVGPLVVD